MSTYETLTRVLRVMVVQVLVFSCVSLCADVCADACAEGNCPHLRSLHVAIQCKNPVSAHIQIPK